MNSGAKVFSAKTELRAFMREDIFFLFCPPPQGKGVAEKIPILKFETSFERRAQHKHKHKPSNSQQLTATHGYSQLLTATHSYSQKMTNQSKSRDANNNLVWVRTDGPYDPPVVLGDDLINDKDLAEINDYLYSHGPLMTSEEISILNELNDFTRMDIETRASALLCQYFGCGQSLLADMDEDMDRFDEDCDMKENRHRLLAKSPQGAGSYYCQPYETDEWAWSTHGTSYSTDGSPLPGRNSRTSGNKEVDENNRVLTEVVVAKRGTKYIQGTSKFGKVYIDLKFSRYAPPIGDKVFCIIGLNGSPSMPWKCFRIPPQGQ
mgnify:CR=1 FL=1